MAWYVIYTKPNNEKKVTKYIEDKGINVFCPVYTATRQWSDRVKKIEMPLFRSYIFVSLNDYKNENTEILRIPGVVKFIWWLGKPGIVRDEEIKEIKLFLEKHKKDEIIVDYTINHGDTVNIINGPLAGQTGKYLSNRSTKAVLELNSLGCKIIAVVAINNINKINSI